MACKNEQCRCRNWCEMKIEAVIDQNECDQAKIIAGWWKAKIAGIRDPDEDFGEEDFIDG